MSLPLGPVPGQNGGQPPAIPAQPVPTQILIAQVRSPQGALVVLQAVTPVGVAVYFLDADAAIRVGGMLTHFGTAAKAGIILPTEGDLA